MRLEWEGVRFVCECCNGRDEENFFFGKTRVWGVSGVSRSGKWDARERVCYMLFDTFEFLF